MPEIMSENGAPAPGFVTTHDQFAISWSEDEARAKVHRFLETRSEAEARSLWRLCWPVAVELRAGQEGTRHPGAWERSVQPVLYRPFDVRWTVFDSNVAVHQRKRVTAHLRRGPNIALITSKLTKGEELRAPTGHSARSGGDMHVAQDVQQRLRVPAVLVRLRGRTRSAACYLRVSLSVGVRTSRHVSLRSSKCGWVSTLLMTAAATS